MADNSAEARKVQNETTIHYPLCQKPRRYLKNEEEKSKGYESQLERAPMAKCGLVTKKQS